jgi:hypothetical protein
MKRAKDFTPEEIERIIFLSGGNSASVIAEMYGTTKAVVLGILRRDRTSQKFVYREEPK